MRRAAVLLLLLGLLAAPAAAAIEPFYRNRMESGLRAFDRADWPEAAHQLRIACFGYLEEPVALVEGLVRLALVEAALGNEDAFRRLFSRLTELEERFSAYSAARLPDPVRRQFESQAARLVSTQSLQAVAGFQSIAERADVQRLTAMPPDRRRAELQAKMAAEPERDDWLLAMVRLELEIRRPRAALDWLDRLPPETADLPPATCLRQQAASQSGTCERMDLSHPFCHDVPPGVVEFRLQCLVEAARWPEAAELLATLSPELRARRRVTRLERRVERNLEAAGKTGPSGAEATVVQPPAPLAATPEPALEPSPVDPQELRRLRQRLEEAATADDLAALLSDAEGLAGRHPGSRQAHLLAAEVAYLLSEWPVAVRHFRQAGELGPGEVHLAFYHAVALYESGDPAAAAAVLRPVAERLERTSFVEEYVDRILGPGV